jgi:IrrE N-terminal-like domain
MRYGYTVPPRSKRAIFDLAATVRQAFAPMLGHRGFLPIDRVYEVMHKMLPRFEFEVCDRSEMGDDHGQTFPNTRLIKLREDVYTGMCTGVGRDRFTAAHELGHLFMHSGVKFSRADPSAKPYLNSEWQADNFASALLIDEMRLDECISIEDVQIAFGVSHHAAMVRFKK